ncbi:MAG: cephalosporin hydroxylase family protein [Gammaproteobacteria bacterium]|nr:cephalosporin hydroxylase family protein [Gammaproteobacteria bacterium]MBU0884926.1 cephalosporin hydroxylase family protein [Gammaproteobacteria bacterium]MBU1859546.1 cephalosporin hydroxylase family protein [Gammaproteobacteria bacterium]
MNEIEKFEAEVSANIDGLVADRDVQALSRIWLREITRHKYAYNFKWMGRPIIQFPQDMIAMQEIIWELKPDLIIETGVAHGGSVLYYASLLELVGGDGYVLGIDIDIRAYNRAEIERHPMHKRLQLIQGSSIAAETVAQVAEHVRGKQRVLVILDSNHTHEHVLAELQAYSPFVTKGSHLVIFDTLIEDMPDDLLGDRPWGKGNNPKTALRAFLESSDRFEIDERIVSKLLITVAPDGYLRCVR